MRDRSRRGWGTPTPLKHFGASHVPRDEIERRAWGGCRMRRDGMKRHGLGWQCGAFIIGLALPAVAWGAPAPLVHHTFEEGVSGWTAMGAKGKVALTRDAAHVKEGKAALQFDYTVAKGEMGILMLPAAEV